ncbi:tRNA (carboxymethyluridine(34)-5-O)-methyltransferase alkbh8-like [Antedon mediterranea]|uniref:tRNA (carboxymethyluridine(34)-5-O)-methyltransferase alkbh8-like n=1 Tax=Antedon mediterranea TaxID=105859 RepID=UPI003AF78E1B
MKNESTMNCDATQKKSTKQDRKLGKKLNKCRHLLLKHENIKPSYHPTKDIFVANGGLLNQIQHHEMVEVFGQYSGLDRVFMVEGKPYSFVSFKTSSFAEKAFKYLQAFELHDKPGPEKVVLYLLYVNDVPAYIRNIPDTSTLPPGLHLIQDFIDEALEQQLVRSLQWDTSTLETDQVLKQRKVQHFGYRFCYDTNDVDRVNPLPGGLGVLYQGIADRILTSDLVKYPLDQLTINQYQPGHGIPSHVDTHSAFEDGFCSLSLGSQVVMLFTHPSGRQVPLVLPPRSLLVLSGEARYLWSHGIISRKSDVVPTKDGLSEGALTVVPRGVRTSFTFRSVKWTPCKCAFPERCDSQGYVKDSEALSSTSKTPVKLPSTEHEAATLEASHVHDVYDNIASHFSETRYKAWPPVVDFLQGIPFGSIVLDIGCGNGKYLGINSNLYKFGCDRSRNLVSVCRERSHQAFVCDSLSLPVRGNSLDVCICIAVLHHFTTAERRLHGLKEIVRVLRPGGKALVTVWALEQEKNKKKSTYLKKTKSDAKSRSNKIGAIQDRKIENKLGVEDINISNLNIEELSDDKLCSSGGATQGDKIDSLKVCGEEAGTTLMNSSDLSETTGKSESATSEITINENVASLGDTGVEAPVNSDLNVHSNRTQFKQQDMLVPWHFKKPGEKVTSEKDFEVYHRFYHVFVDGELQSLCSELSDVTIDKCYYVEGNWFIIFQKNF